MDKISLSDRLENGNLFISEVCALKPCSRSKFYDDVAEGKVTIEKSGSRSVVRGPVAKRYIAGEPIDDLKNAIERVAA
jgi:hypothetical protein